VRDRYRENNEPTQRHERSPRRDYAGRDGYHKDNETTQRHVRKQATS